MLPSGKPPRASTITYETLSTSVIWLLAEFQDCQQHPIKRGKCWYS